MHTLENSLCSLPLEYVLTVTHHLFLDRLRCHANQSI